MDNYLRDTLDAIRATPDTIKAATAAKRIQGSQGRRRRSFDPERRLGWRDREAAARGLTVYQFRRYLDARAARDFGNRCALCGVETVAMDISHPGPQRHLARTWDHIQPQRHGGDSTDANLRLACLRCNMTRKHTDA